MDVQRLRGELAELGFVAGRVDRVAVGDRMEQPVSLGARIRVAPEEILCVVLKVVRKVAELGSTAERRESGVDEEVLSSLGFELLPLVGACHPPDQ